MIYLIRHTTPAIARGMCYGQTALLAKELFPDRPLRLSAALMEIHCGDWEMRAWDDLPPLHYGCVIRVFEAGDGLEEGVRGEGIRNRWEYEVLCNPAPVENEQHKPKAFYQ